MFISAYFCIENLGQMELNEHFWNSRYIENNTPWDIGGPSPALIRYFEGLKDKRLELLIPGGGYAHEATYLCEKGFQNVHICDWSKQAARSYLKKNPGFPKNQFIVKDFFKINQRFDLIVEQTFFCALDPHLRPLYVSKMANILKPGGKLVGLLFASEFEKEGPPFGGTKDEYISLFKDFFDIIEMDSCLYSIAPRMGNELFVEMEVKIK